MRVRDVDVARKTLRFSTMICQPPPGTRLRRGAQPEVMPLAGMASREMNRFRPHMSGRRIAQRGDRHVVRERAEAVRAGEIVELADARGGGQTLRAVRRESHLTEGRHHADRAVAQADEIQLRMQRRARLVDQMQVEAVQAFIGS